MQKICFAIVICFCVLAAAAQKNTLHHKAILVDTHNDFPSIAINQNLSLDMDLKGKTHTDLARMREGGIDVQVFSIWCDGDEAHPFARANREIDSVHAWAANNPEALALAYNSRDIKKAIKQKKIALMSGVEGGHMMENNLDNLQHFYNRGVRYMTLTWNNSTPWASSAADESNPRYDGHKGLTDFGKKVVSKMNDLGMLVDLSHVGEQTVSDVLAVTTKPVLVSHSCVHAICPVFRNLTDEQIKAIAKNGGVIHLNFFAGFVDSNYLPRFEALRIQYQPELDAMIKANPEADKDYLMMKLADNHKDELEAVRPSLDQLLNHLDYIVKLVGINHVGLGSDFDGISVAPKGLEGVEDFPRITDALLQRGYSKKDIGKILGGNFLRLLKSNEP